MRKSIFPPALVITLVSVIVLALSACQKDNLATFLGTYTGTSCYAPDNICIGDKKLVITAGAGANNLIIIGGCVDTVKATFSGDTLTVPLQNGISGYGILSGSDLGIGINYSDSVGTRTGFCNFGGTRQ